MKALIPCLVCVVIWLGAIPALGVMIPVGNSSFEDHVLAPDDATENGEGLSPWTFDPGLDVGVWNISDGSAFPGGAPDGFNVAYSYGFNVSQVLNETLTGGSVYELVVAVGASPFFVFPGYRVQLWAGNALLAEDNNALTIAPGTHEESKVIYPSPSDDPNAGSFLEIRLLALGPEVTFDDVTLSRIDCASINPIAFWPAEGTAEDVAGVYAGALEGDTTFSAGKVAQAFSFDGEQDQVTLTTFPAGNTFTIEGWVYYLGTSTPPWTTIYVDGNHGFLLNDLRLSWWDWGERFAGGSQISVAEWHHVAITYDASLSIFSGYVDGVPDGTSIFAGAALPPGEPVVSIGGHDSGVDVLEGMIDELAVYDRVLSASEILSIHTRGAAGKCMMFRGHFETGDTSRWSGVVP